MAKYLIKQQEYEKNHILRPVNGTPNIKVGNFVNDEDFKKIIDWGFQRDTKPKPKIKIFSKEWLEDEKRIFSHLNYPINKFSKSENEKKRYNFFHKIKIFFGIICNKIFLINNKTNKSLEIIRELKRLDEENPNWHKDLSLKKYGKELMDEAIKDFDEYEKSKTVEVAGTCLTKS